MEINFEITPIFERLESHLNKDGIRYICARGGSSSSKSISILQLLLIWGLQNKGKTINIITESMVKAKRSLIPDFQNIVLKDLNSVIEFNKTESTFILPNRTIIRFISAEDPAKVVGIRSDILYADEADTINYEVLNQLSIRTRDKILFSFNPRAKFKFYESVEKRKDFVEDISTYIDNPFLEQSIIDDLLERASKDENFKRVYLEGEWGNFEGLIFKENFNWYQIDDLPEQYDKELWGIDWGFSNDPSTLIQARFVGDSIYIKEYLYQNGLLNRDIAAKIKKHNQKNVKTIADSAEPKSIAELKKIYGINIFPVKKPEILPSIDTLLSKTIYVTRDSINTIKEFRNYMWDNKKKDKKGRVIPIDAWNHVIDPLRYVASTHYKPTKSYIKVVKI